jgi:tRNA dimethylallyltransferase
MYNCIVVCGPTASGKTRLGVLIARRLGGEIISCDSRQVYRGMDIGTGKDLAEYGEVPCHLIDIAEPSEIYTVHRYQADFSKAFENIIRRKKLPVVVGGTGLYLEAVLRGYSLPEVPENAAFRAEQMQRDKASLSLELASGAPDLYRTTDLKSRKRIVRSLEIARFGDSSARPGINALPALQLMPIVLCLAIPRPVLRERIALRLDQRLAAGMVDEVKGLLAAGIPRERLAMFGMEYRQIAQYLFGEINYGNMVALLCRDICRLAKRQETWFRGMERRGVKINWVNGGSFDDVLAVIGKAGQEMADRF